jgi:hypothetical protein
MKLETYFELCVYNYGGKSGAQVIQNFRKGIDSAEIKRLEGLLDNAISDHTLSDDDAVYFHSSSGIPRYKFSKFCEDKKIRRVLSPEKATVIVINPKNIDKDNKGYVNKGDFYILPWDFNTMVMGVQIPVVQANTEQPNLQIMGVSNYKNLGKSAQIPDPTFEIRNLTTQYLYNGELEKYLTSLVDIENYLTLTNVKIITENSLNQQMSSTAFSVQEENYKELYNMLHADSVKDFTLGLEMIANSNYIDSKFYVALLLNSCASRIQMGQSSFGVNIKNMLSYFQDVNYSDNTPNFISSLYRSLLKDKTISDEKERTLREMMLSYLNTEQLKKLGVTITSFTWR